MRQSLDQILEEVREGDSVNVTMVSNQDNGIVGYADGRLRFRNATGGVLFGGPRYQPARLESVAEKELLFYFSDRMLDIDPPPVQGDFGKTPRQPFNANATEKLGMSIFVGTPHVMQLAAFGHKSFVTLSPMSDLLVGVGPSLGQSAAGVVVVAFTGIVRAP